MTTYENMQVGIYKGSLLRAVGAGRSYTWTIGANRLSWQPSSEKFWVVSFTEAS